MKAILTAFVFIFLFTLQAEGVDWVQVTSTPRRDIYFVDKESIIHAENKNVRTTTKHVLKEPIHEEKGSIYSTQSYEEYDCRQGRTRRTSVRAYDINENILWHYSPLRANSPEISVSWRLIKPGTSKHAIYKFLCNPQ